MKLIEFTKFNSLVTKALEDNGVITSSLRLNWDISQKCDKPYEVVLYTAPPKDAVSPFVGVQRYTGRGVRFLSILTPCRKCNACRQARGRLWRYRSMIEISQSSRTWFCTFTVNPDYRMRLRLRADSWDFDKIYKELSKDFTKYLKRLRFTSGVKFRYLLVGEKHKDGFPHLHALIHERGVPITKRQIQSEWKFGFSDAKLCDSKASKYITKYIFKENIRRVRSSLTYGHALGHTCGRVEDTTQGETKTPKSLIDERTDIHELVISYEQSRSADKENT